MHNSHKEHAFVNRQIAQKCGDKNVSILYNLYKLHKTVLVQFYQFLALCTKKYQEFWDYFCAICTLDKAKGLVLRLRLSTQEQSNTLHYIDKNHKKYYNKRKGIERSDNTMITLQFTLFSTTGKYKPVTTLIKVDSVQQYNENKHKYQQRAITKMCAEKHTTWWALKSNGFTKLKVRVYPKNNS